MITAKEARIKIMEIQKKEQKKELAAIEQAISEAILDNERALFADSLFTATVYYLRKAGYRVKFHPNLLNFNHESSYWEISW